MTHITKECLNCQSEFQASLKEHKRGNAKFCCISCVTSYKNKNRKPLEANCKCDVCDIPFYRSASKQKLSKHGFQFCSRSCKDSAQKFDNHEKFSKMLPDHYGTKDTKYNYREVAFSSKPYICERCDYDEIPQILQVHHKDRDRTNNNIDNLEVLCPTCHMADHYLNRDGIYRNMVDRDGYAPSLQVCKT